VYAQAADFGVRDRRDPFPVAGEALVEPQASRGRLGRATGGEWIVRPRVTLPLAGDLFVLGADESRAMSPHTGWRPLESPRAVASASQHGTATKQRADRTRQEDVTMALREPTRRANAERLQFHSAKEALEDELKGLGLGYEPGPDTEGTYDVGRKQIDRIVLHHTVTPPNASWRTISEIHRDNIYGTNYPHSYHTDPETGEETFVVYHFLVYFRGMNPDGGGLVRRCLRDDEIGWHAGDKDANQRSVAFSFVGDFRHHTPTEEQLRAVAEQAAGYDREIGGRLLVRLHSEESATACPARVGEYRDRLIDLINEVGGDDQREVTLASLEQLSGNGNLIAQVREWQGLRRSRGEDPYHWPDCRTHIICSVGAWADPGATEPVDFRDWP
jgi:hypothetical protein